jgi:hypothetical protein
MYMFIPPRYVPCLARLISLDLNIIIRLGDVYIFLNYSLHKFLKFPHPLHYL